MIFIVLRFNLFYRKKIILFIIMQYFSIVDLILHFHPSINIIYAFVEKYSFVIRLYPCYVVGQNCFKFQIKVINYSFRIVNIKYFEKLRLSYEANLVDCSRLRKIMILWMLNIESRIIFRILT